MIHFDESKHEYKDEIGVLPSVTQIIEDVGLKSSAFYKPGSADKGREIHKAISLLELGKLDWASVPEEYYGYLEAWVNCKEKLKKDIGVTVLATECIGSHPKKRYAGTIDCVLKNDTFYYICDIKTGKKEKWHKVQVVAYSDMYESSVLTHLGVKASLPLVAYIHDNGTFETDQEMDGEVNTLKTVWDSCLHLYYWKRKDK